MIEKMKKLTFLVTNREYDGFIDSVRQLGVVHVDQLQQGATSDELREAMALEQRYQKALQVLDAAKSENAQALGEPAPAVQERTPLQVLERVEQLDAEQSQLEKQLAETDKTIALMLPWGEFNPQDVAALGERVGRRINYFVAGRKQYREEWETDYYATVVAEVDKQVYFLTFSDQTPDIQAQFVAMPEKSRTYYELQREQQAQSLSLVRSELAAISGQQRALLEQGKTESQQDIQLSKVHLSDERLAGDHLRLLQGWVMDEKKQPLVDYLESEHIYYEMTDPAFEDDVPVELREGSFSRLFLPILKMYSLPKYSELDPTQSFAPFFTLFFGLCLGDAGYGLLVFLAGLFLVKKLSDDKKDYGRLALWLGGSTIVCGLLTGTVFGIDLCKVDWAFVRPIQPYLLNEGSALGQWFINVFGYTPMMVISVMLGLVQVLIGMTMKGIKASQNYGIGYGVGTFSWVLFIIAAVVLWGLPAFGVALPQALCYLLYALVGIASVGILLYNNPAAYKNPVLGPLVNIGAGAYSVYSMATGLLGDLLSYIRLFALGLTGGVLGGVFNSLATSMTEGMPIFVRWLPMVLILLFGHGITFALSLISAFVHPMRLIFVEFFKNANYEGGGRAYTPFGKKTNN